MTGLTGPLAASSPDRVSHTWNFISSCVIPKRAHANGQHKKIRKTLVLGKIMPLMLKLEPQQKIQQNNKKQIKNQVKQNPKPKLFIDGEV